MYRQILVATDGSELSRKAIAEGVELARLSHAQLRFVTCSQPYNVVTMVEPLMLARQHDYESNARSAAEERLRLARSAAAERGVQAEVEHVFSAEPYRGILDAAAQHGSDVIVMASHGRPALEGALLGSQTVKVLSHSKIPVLVCR